MLINEAGLIRLDATGQLDESFGTAGAIGLPATLIGSSNHLMRSANAVGVHRTEAW